MSNPSSNPSKPSPAVPLPSHRREKRKQSIPNIPTNKPPSSVPKKYSLPPNPSGVPYTLPAAVLPDGTWIMDSANIARALEAAHPDPPLRLDAALLPEVERLVAAAGAALGPVVYARVPVTILNEASLGYWYETRRRRLGVTVQELEETKGGEAAYAAAEPHLRGLTALLLRGKEEEGGPFFMGREVSYADFVWVALLAFLERVDGGVFAEVLRRTGDEGVHRALLEACGAWLERRSY